MKPRKEKLLKKYYSGETSLEEEARLKKQIVGQEQVSPEYDSFSFYEGERSGMGDLEEVIFLSIKKQEKRSITRKIISIASAAAVLLIALGIYLDFRDKKMKELENSFFVMEQAMFQVSENIRPHEPEEMFVLWIDEDVEIIIN